MKTIIQFILKILQSMFGRTFSESPIPKQIVIQPINERKKLDIIVDKQVRTQYQSGWINKIRKKPITELVIHGTGGGTSAEGILYWMMLGERAKEYNQGIALFHYLIDRAGPNIIEVIDPAYYVYHSSSGQHDQETIGIEHINPSKGNREAPTDEQYDLLFKLIFVHLLPTYPTIKSIVSHDYNMYCYSKLTPKGCPGPGFDWVRVEEELTKHGIKFERVTTGAYEII